MEKKIFCFAGELGFVETILRAECAEEGCAEMVKWEGDYCHRHEPAHMCKKCGCVDCAEHAEVK